MTNTKETPMDKWCRENGYDKHGVFIYTGEGRKKGYEIFLCEDDLSDCPFFRTKEGVEVAAHFCHLKQEVVQPSAKTDSFPETPFKLKCGDKPEVRQWLKDNGCKWSSGRELTTDYLKRNSLLYVEEGKKISCTRCTEIYNETSIKEVTPIIQPEQTIQTVVPAKVVGFSLGDNHKKAEKKKKKLERKIKKLQNKLNNM